MKSKIIAIHQPNFFPWLGFFDKIARSDEFVILDDVQYQKTGGMWSNRVKFLIEKDARWITAPIVRNYHGLRNINEMEFQHNVAWRKKIIKTIENNYRKASYFNEAAEFFYPLILNETKNMADYNTHSCIVIAKRLGLDDSKFHLSSKLPHEGRSNQLLVSIVKLLNGSHYLCGGGADGYQDEEVFNQAGIDVIFQNFNHPVYEQVKMNTFVSGLSIFDAVANIGWENTKKLILQT